MRTRMIPTLTAILILVASTLGTARTATASTYIPLAPALEIAPDGYGASSVTDAQGALHIVFARYQKPGLWYATNATGAWVTKKISTTSGLPKVAIDTAGHLYIAYDSGAGIRLLTNWSGTWAGTALTTASTDRYPAIAVDALGEVHVAYGEGELIYLTNRRGYWVRRTLVQSGAYRPAISLDTKRRVHIAYEGAGADLRYITDADGISWKASTITVSGKVPSIAVHGTVPSVTFARPNDGNGGLYYATRGTTGWASVRMYPAYIGNEGTSSLRIAADGKAHVAYQAVDSAGASIVGYATNATGTWVRTTIGGGGGPAMVLGPSGARHITFSTVAVYLRSLTASTWSATTVAPSAYDTQPDVVDGPDGLPRVVYAVPFSNPGLRSAVWNGSGFTATRITYGEEREPAITVDADGKTHVVFVRNGAPATLWHGTDATGAWVFKKIASDDGFACPDIAIGVDGHVHVTARRTHSDAGFIQYRPVWYTNATGAWTVREDLPFVTGADACPTLDVDADDDPHIAYVDVQLHYTHLVAGVWSTETFGDASYLGGQIAIAPDGSIVLTYGRQNDYTSATGGLYVQTDATGTWVSTLVGKTADPIARHGLAVDASGDIHLAYRGFIWDPGLHYATDHSGAWTVVRLRDRDMSGPALSVSAAGAPDIVYIQGGTGGGLTGGLQHAHP